MIRRCIFTLLMVCLSVFLSVLIPVNTNVFASEKTQIPQVQESGAASNLISEPDNLNKNPPLRLLPEHSSTGNMLNVTFGLLVVLLFIALTAWLVRRFGNFQVTAKGNLKIVGGLHLGTRERVVLIQVGEQQLLVGVAPGRIQTLHVLDQPLSMESQSSTSKERFSDKLASVLKGSKPK